MRAIYFLFFIFWRFLSALTFESEEELDKFLGDLIDTWQLRSPTLIVRGGDSPKLCMSRKWLLCLSDGLDSTELSNHLSLTHQHQKQDGIILVGRAGYEQLLRKLAKRSPFLLTANCPVFMPERLNRLVTFAANCSASASIGFSVGRATNSAFDSPSAF